MYTSRFFLGVAIVAAFLICTHNVDAGNLWPNVKGEICLYNSSNNEYSKIAVQRTVGNNFIIQGIVDEDGGDKTLFNGNAVLKGNTVWINLNGSGYDPASGEVHAGAGWVELDAATLEGWFTGIGYHCEPPDTCGMVYEGIQQLEAATCP